MCTVAIAWINAKYRTGYKYLFIGAIMVDIALFETLTAMLDKCG
ncbi:MAG TPA: hypothetical protein VI911_00945 [Patescibacteria group bacterium]|nr:hypothetical protein [Patescibacteria group bacterium]